jgi:biotin-dependent carboxylase-like uncharacterized protein
MDPLALATLNILVGNERDCAAVEMALTGGVFSFDAAVTFALGGADSVATLHTEKLESYRVYRAAAGDMLTIESISGGRFLYAAFSGGLDVPEVLGSRSTYTPGAFGGIDGRRLKTGDELRVGDHSARKYVVSDSLPSRLRPPIGSTEIRFIPRVFAEAAEIAGTYTVSASSDRMGYRLEGFARDGGQSVTSEPVCPGVIQLPPGGAPIILMADAPTIGGYRVMGGVISADIGTLSQKLPGDTVTLTPISMERARREVEKLAEVETLVEEWCLS